MGFFTSNHICCYFFSTLFPISCHENSSFEPTAVRNPFLYIDSVHAQTHDANELDGNPANVRTLNKQINFHYNSK